MQQIAKYIDQSALAHYHSFSLQKSGILPAVSAQKRMFIMQQFESGSVGYNMPMMWC